MIVALAWAAVALAAIPAVLTLLNLGVYRRAPGPAPALGPVSVLIPARNEETRIGATLEALLRTRGVEIEVCVLDDASTDGTAEVVRRIAAVDSRVRLVRGEGPPEGWNGKQYACQRLSEHARHELLLFVDADVRMASEGIARLKRRLRTDQLDLLSGVPRQLTGSLAEAAVVPLIHFVLVGFLPMAAMRRSASPAYAAGCGQLMLVRRQAYQRAGGHASLRDSRHDGLKLPRAFRRAGLRTGLVDATDLATCRMYEGAAEVLRGFAKNADEGMATPRAILPWTVLLGGGQVLPWLMVPAVLGTGAVASAALPVALAATLGLATRALQAVRFRLPAAGVLLHPIGVATLLAVQWYSLGCRLCGRRIAWRGRADLPEAAR